MKIQKLNESLDNKSTYMCDDCGYEIELNDNEFDGKCPNCGEHSGFYKLEEAKQSVKPDNVQMFYDRHLRLWTIYLIDEEGNQISDAEYAPNRKDAVELANDTNNFRLRESMNEDLYGEYSNKFHELAERYLEDDNAEALKALCFDIIRYAKEEDLKDLWVDRDYEKLQNDKEDETEDISEAKLNEDVEVPTLEGPKEGAEYGLSDLINTAIQNELSTVNEYNTLALNARAEGYDDIASVVDEINTEENKHIGQLQEILKTISPNAQAIVAGETEASDDLVSVDEE